MKTFDRLLETLLPEASPFVKKEQKEKTPTKSKKKSTRVIINPTKPEI